MLLFCSTSLVNIALPPTIKVIKDHAFYKCWGLITVILNNGLEEIGLSAFVRCASLVLIAIPPRHQGDQDSRILQVLRVENCDTHQCTGGDWVGGIFKMHVPRTHCETPHHQVDQKLGIQRLHAVEDCDSQ